ncbi:UNKNOWN [Stylonychia lemnae]|uniref:Uncharacterized protein n=1 Tax=Stylonychia lemnae TaxID=5949 RepID=A0A078ARQ5_STYLE|nr:UNKNOWN [Stylonychia lemnae]|eukprot:CDW83548.1 UNKNOWN [Stylonychia lemnae]
MNQTTSQIQGGNNNHMMNQDFSMFSIPFDNLDFEFLSPQFDSNHFNIEEPFRMRLDSEYLWEGEEMMYEDIVASTQPLNYNQHTMRKRIDDFQFHMQYMNHQEQMEDLEITQQIEIRPYQSEQQVCQNSCGRNPENEEEQFGLDSTIISNLDFNQSMAPFNQDFNFDMLDLEQQELSFMMRSMTNPQLLMENDIPEPFENPFLIQNSIFQGQQSSEDQFSQTASEATEINQSLPNPILKQKIVDTLEGVGDQTGYFEEESKGPSYQPLGVHEYNRKRGISDVTQTKNPLSVNSQVSSSERHANTHKAKIPRKIAKKDHEEIHQEEEVKEPQKKKKVAVTSAHDLSAEAEQTFSHDQTSNDKYYKKFDFFYKRTCFRLMAEFYKLLFQPFQKLWIEQKKKSAMSALLQSFASRHFESTLSKLPANNKVEFVNILMAVVHSHRHNKEDSFLSESSVDFSLVRDTMYKYSKKAQERFFSIPVFAFLFAWFAQSQEGMKFTYQKFQQKGQDYFIRIKTEIEELKDEAIQWLKKHVAAKADAKAQVLIKQLEQ